MKCQSSVAQMRAALAEIANLAHLAWLDPTTVEKTFLLIEAKARAILQNSPQENERGKPLVEIL